MIAAEIETVIGALTSRAFDRDEFQRRLDRFYVAVESAAKGLEDWSEKQAFLNTVYERFFQGFSVKQADTHVIVYTPQEIVDFMCASVEEVLKREFGTSLSEPSVQILDPCTGTGNFVVNLIRRISGASLRQKYEQDLFANEIMLLPYYIASLNIEHAYYERTGEYRPFDGLCFTDTLDLAEGWQMQMFTEPNTKRVEREKAAQIMVVIGNPPYNMGQKKENENNKNRRYPVIDSRIGESYVKDSNAQLNNKLYDPYVKFFRWATDRLGGRDGLVCFVSNNSFIDQIAFDGMRKNLEQDFTQIYHLDLHGNVRKNPHLSGTTHNVFGIQAGVGITIAVRRSDSPARALRYFRLPEDWRKETKLALLAEKTNIAHVDWLELQPDGRHTWLTEGLHPEFAGFSPVGSKDAKGARISDAQAIFKSYSLGIVSSRDGHVYSFDFQQLHNQAEIFVEVYNQAVDAAKRRGIDADTSSIINTADQRIKWSRQVKASLSRLQYSHYFDAHIRKCLYRPFTRKLLYFDDFWNEERYQQYLYFPAPASESENVSILIKVGTEWPMFPLVANTICDFLPQGGSQCFPFYTYAEDGTNRRENITDWALGQFRARYGDAVTTWDIFHYVYGLLHHPHYRARYAENLKRELPRIPLLPDRAGYDACVAAGRALARLHLDYERVPEYRLRWVEAPASPSPDASRR